MSITVRSLLLLALLLSADTLLAQSGKGAVHGYINFDGVAQDELAAKNIAATVTLRLRGVQGGKEYIVPSDQRGTFAISDVLAREYTLTISARGYKPYKLDLYLPSDFQWNMAVNLRRGRK